MSAPTVRGPQAPRIRGPQVPGPRPLVSAAALVRAYARQDPASRRAMLDAAESVAVGSRTHPALVPAAQTLLRALGGGW